MTRPKSTLDGLIEFLDRAGAKGWINASSATALKSTAGRIGGVLDDHEKADISGINVNDAVRRFGNLNPDVSPASLKTYLSRFSKAIDLFTAYSADPMKWQPPASSGVSRRGKRKTERKSTETTTPATTVKHESAGGRIGSGDGGLLSGFTYPFPLRPDLTIMVSNIPRDLKMSEVERVCAFLRSLSTDYTP